MLSLVGLLGITNTQTDSEVDKESGLPILRWKLKDSLTVLVMLSVAAVAFWTKVAKYIQAAKIKLKEIMPEIKVKEKEPDPYGLGPGTANPEWTVSATSQLPVAHFRQPTISELLCYIPGFRQVSQTALNMLQEKMVTITTMEVVSKSTPYYIRRDHLGRIVEKSWKHPCPPPPDPSDAPEMDVEQEDEEEEMINPLARAIDTDPWRRLSQLVDDPEAERANEQAKQTRAQKLAARSAKLHNDIPRQSLPEVLVIANLEGMEPGQLLNAMKDKGNASGKDAASVIVQQMEETHKADEDLRDELCKLEVKPLQRWISKRNFTLLEYELVDAVDSDTPKASVVELVISAMTLRRLSKRARLIGCAYDKVQDVIDSSDDPCVAMIRLMKEQHLLYSTAKRIEFARQLPWQRGLEVAIGVNDIRFEFEGAGLYGRLDEYAWLKARALSKGVLDLMLDQDLAGRALAEPRPAKAYLEEIEAQDHEHLTQEALLETMLALIELPVLQSSLDEEMRMRANEEAKAKADAAAIGVRKLQAERAAKVRLKMPPLAPAQPSTATSAQQVS